jgi:hypothetical protein
MTDPSETYAQPNGSPIGFDNGFTLRTNVRTDGLTNALQDQSKSSPVPNTPTPVDKPAKVTERNMLDALRRRYTTEYGNGDRWIRAEHVRNGTGFYGYDTLSGRCTGALRTADFVALDGWESKKHVIHGHEVKVSRSDWFTELKDPEKAEAFRPYCDYWWLVTSSPLVAKVEELPAGWGLITMTTSGALRMVKQARKIERKPMPWPMMVGLARAIQKTGLRHGAQDVAS